MKTLKNKFWALLTITSVALFSCKKEDPIPPTVYAHSNPAPAAPDANYTDWKITTYQIGDVSNTKVFAGYLFNIKEDGTAEAYNSTSRERGVWNMVNKDQVNIQFSKAPLSELNGEKWSVLSKTNEDIKLETKNSKDQTVSLSLQRYLKRTYEDTPKQDAPDLDVDVIQ